MLHIVKRLIIYAIRYIDKHVSLTKKLTTEEKLSLGEQKLAPKTCANQFYIIS